MAGSNIKGWYDGMEAEAKQKIAQASRAESAKIKGFTKQKSAQAVQKVEEKAKTFTESAFKVSISANPVLPSPRFNQMSESLREYMRVMGPSK